MRKVPVVLIMKDNLLYIDIADKLYENCVLVNSNKKVANKLKKYIWGSRKSPELPEEINNDILYNPGEYIILDDVYENTLKSNDLISVRDLFSNEILYVVVSSFQRIRGIETLILIDERLNNRECVTIDELRSKYTFVKIVRRKKK